MLSCRDRRPAQAPADLWPPARFPPSPTGVDFMKAKNLVLAVLALALASPVHAQTADELIAKNIKAKGGMDKIKAMKSLRATGHMALGPEMEAPFVMTLKRPNEMRMEFTLQGMTGIQAYDG